MNVDFVVTSPLCLSKVSAAAAKGTTLQSLLELSGPRENAYELSQNENLLLSPPTGFTPPSGSDLYGTTCLADTDAVFREGDAVDFGFQLVEREPQCFAAGLWPWDAGNLCSGYKDTPVTGEPISICGGGTFPASARLVPLPAAVRQSQERLVQASSAYSYDYDGGYLDCVVRDAVGHPTAAPTVTAAPTATPMVVAPT